MEEKEPITQQASETPATDATVAPQTSHTPPSVGSEEPKRNGNTLLVVVVILAILIAGALYFFFGTSAEEQGAQDTQGAATILSTIPEGPVATVNGEVIEGATYEDAVSQLAQNALAQGGDLTDLGIQAAIKEQALTQLVNNTLLRQKAAAENIVASTDDIDAEVARLETQLGGTEAFTARLDEVGITMEELREDISDQIVIGTYVQEQIDFETTKVTDEEIATFYEQIAANAEDLPALEELQGQIREQLVAQKQQEQVVALIESLRAAADIELLI